MTLATSLSPSPPFFSSSLRKRGPIGAPRRLPASEPPPQKKERPPVALRRTWRTREQVRDRIFKRIPRLTQDFFIDSCLYKPVFCSTYDAVTVVIVRGVKRSSAVVKRYF